MIPQTFEQWKQCIVKDCRINLTKEFAEQRLSVYRNAKNPETHRFVALYGEQHLNNIIYWLKQV